MKYRFFSKWVNIKNLPLWSVLFFGVVFSAGKGGGLRVFKVDTARSRIQWQCDKHSGHVRLYDGELILKKGKITAGNFRIDMGSLVDEDIEYELMRLTLQNVLKSEEFFHVKRYPFATFKILFVRYLKKNEAHVAGDLVVRGVTRTIGFDVKIDREGKTLIAKSERFCLDRTKWGVTAMSQKVATSEDQFIVPDEIFIKIELFAAEE